MSARDLSTPDGPPSLLPSVFGRDQTTSSPNARPSEDELEQEQPYIEPENEAQLLPPPNFAPFFTVIEDVTTGDHYHPSVHYVFSDDDAELITAASMRALGFDDAQEIEGPSTLDNVNDALQSDHEDDEGTNRNGGHDQETPQIVSALPPPRSGTHERYIVVDLAPDGQSISQVQSLSADWQATSAEIRPPPTSWEGSALQDGASALMLTIEGIEVSQETDKPDRPADDELHQREAGEHMLQEAKKASGGDMFGGLDAILGKMDRELSLAERVVGDIITKGDSQG